MPEMYLNKVNGQILVFDFISYFFITYLNFSLALYFLINHFISLMICPMFIIISIHKSEARVDSLWSL